MESAVEMQVDPPKGPENLPTDVTSTPQDFSAQPSGSSSNSKLNKKYLPLPGSVANKTKKEYMNELEEFFHERFMTLAGWLRILYYIFPVLYWLPRYQWRNWIRGDLMAGLTVGVMLVPQGMAYASIAELPPIYGLYSAMIPLMAYFIFGTSGQLAVGPVAIMSILVAEGVNTIVDSKENPEEYLRLVLILTILVGIIQASFGLLRLGFIVTILSPSVITGFSTASAIIIGTSQLKDLFGISIPRSSDFFITLYNSFAGLGHAQWLPIVMGFLSIIVIYLLQRWKSFIPWSLIVVIIDTVISFLINKYTSVNLPIVNKVPSGLPHPHVPSFNGEDFASLISIAFILSLVGFMESISVAKKYAQKYEQDLDANQELMALGLSNIFGSFFLSYPVTGGFSRTAVNDNAGARTPLSSLISSLVILLSLVLLTPLFTYIPKCALSAIIIVAIIKLIEIGRFKKLWRVKKTDFLVAFTTFWVTLGAGVEIGIGVGAGVSLMFIIYESSRPHTAELGSVPGKIGTHYRNILRYPDAAVHDHIIVCRIDSSLYFANSSFVSEQVEKYLKQSTSKKPTKYLIVECTTINSIDFTGLDVLKKLNEKLKNKKITLLMAGVKGPVADVIKKVHLEETLGEKSFFFSVAEAVEYAQAQLQSEAAIEPGDIRV